MSGSDYFSDLSEKSHISLTETDLEDLPDLDQSDISEEERNQEDELLLRRINIWLENTSINQTQRLEEMYADLITNMINYSLQFNIENLNLLSFDMLFHLELAELENYRENLLIRAETIPRTLNIMVNQHLEYVTNRINYIIALEFHN